MVVPKLLQTWGLVRNCENRSKVRYTCKSCKSLVVKILTCYHDGNLQNAQWRHEGQRIQDFRTTKAKHEVVLSSKNLFFMQMKIDVHVDWNIIHRIEILRVRLVYCETWRLMVWITVLRSFKSWLSVPCNMQVDGLVNYVICSWRME